LPAQLHDLNSSLPVFARDGFGHSMFKAKAMGLHMGRG